MKKEMFNGYLYGYLNEYYLNKTYLTEEVDFSYKKLKVNKILSYLKIPSKYFQKFSSFILIISKIEITISILILFYRLVKYSLKYMFTSKNYIKNSKLMLGLNCDKMVFFKMLESVNVTKDDFVIVEIPTVKTKYTDFKRISIFKGIRFLDILKSFMFSLEMVFLMKKKYGRRDFLFRAHSSFEYFLCYFFVTRSDRTNVYYFDALIDRWAYLLGNINHTTYLIQHGILGDAFKKLKKIGSVNYAYYIDEEQKEICEKKLFENKPVAYFRNSLKFNSNEKLVKNEFKNVLLICNMIFYEKEKEIIKDLEKKEINLYVKPHPADSYDPYNKLLTNNNFILLEKKDLLEVDVVISYISTLATEYEKNNTLVLRYSDESFLEDYNKVFGNNKVKA
ncbi:hypothetical protein [uncultured Tenacibaculum sp.]|uniref:hypothetical protein n=1 Tax=uncultured Tenacibaculum sp. TaxID=174713 RepID=UPI0026028FBA|nr:hypothetical protein [uncultured Tenacibaculum sp.]